MSDLNAMFRRIRSITGKKRKQQTRELPKESPTSQKEAVEEQKRGEALSCLEAVPVLERAHEVLCLMEGKKCLVGLGACLLFVEKHCLSHVREKENLDQQTAGLVLAIPSSHCVVVRLTSDKKPDVFILLIFKNLSVSLLRSPLLEVSALVSVQMNT